MCKDKLHEKIDNRCHCLLGIGAECRKKNVNEVVSKENTKYH